MTGTINNTTGLKVSSISQIKGSVSQGNELVNKSRSHVSKERLKVLLVLLLTKLQNQDVDISAVADGSILQFRASDQKWVARNQLDTTTGSLVFNGGSF